jgi:hypothetical protein
LIVGREPKIKWLFLFNTLMITALVGCEESQAVTIALRKKGIRAFSCDTLPCSGGHPEWHIQDDIFNVINGGSFTVAKDYSFEDYEIVYKWDRVITFQPCTDLTVSGARWFEKKRLSGEQEQSIRFFYEVWKFSNCSENPIGIINGGEYIKKWFPILYEEMKAGGFPFKPSQIIQPWMFGHGETKATCLWLRDLPNLIPTNIVEGREQNIWRMAPGPDRAKMRSKTFPGIAEAMADQWGRQLTIPMQLKLAV